MCVSKIILLGLVVMIIGAEANPLLVKMGDSKPNDIQPGTDSKDKQPVFTDHYDQRQNGTENFRLKVDGLVFIMAPAESLLLAGAALNEPNFASLLSENNDKPMPKPEKDELLKPSKKPEPEKLFDFKANTQDSAHEPHKPSLRISHLLAPFLNRFRHAKQGAHDQSTHLTK